MKRLLLALAAGFLVCSAGAVEFSAQERDGQRIFLEGASPSGARIAARIGMGTLDVSGVTVACGNCHGTDGRGRSEGGIEPPSILWSELAKPYGHKHASGRQHGPFDDKHLRRAVMDGVDPDGNRLDGAMPRFSMSEKDFAALAAYLKKVEFVLDPGLSEEAIRIGTLLPMSGSLAGVGESLRVLLGAYFASLNEHGGIHGRRLELLVEALPSEPGKAREAARAMLESGQVFAMLAPFSPGVEAELSSAAASLQVPVIGPLTLFPEDARASNQYIFHLLPGIVELAQLLGSQAARELKITDRPIALLHPDTPGGVATAQAVEAQLRTAGWRAPLAVPFAPRGFSADAMAKNLQARQAAAVLVLGAGADVPALARAGARIGWIPHLLLPGPLAPREIVDLPAAFSKHVMLAYPTSPADQRGEALRDYSALVQGAGQARGHQPLQVAAYASGLLLVEGLKRTGRDLSRRRLVATLETLQGFDTGLLPPLSYNADRRIGAMGGYLIAVDVENKALRPVGGYQRLQ